jgi:ribosomal protein S18 acetylase RimI-like enzyme
LASASPEHRAAAGALARAFSDDPFWNYVEPDAPERARELHEWFPIGVRYATRYGTVDAHANGDVVGAALWLPPGHQEMTFWRMLRTGMLRTRRILGGAATGRLTRASHALDAARARLMPAGAEYLWILGVDPAHQGRGQGAATIGIGLQRTDASRRVAYLETYKERNLAFYARHGFEVITEEHPPAGPPFWALQRPARG